MWKIQISMREPIKFSTTLFVFMPIHLRLVKEVIALGWERYGGQIRIWEVTHFWKVCFNFWGK